MQEVSFLLSIFRQYRSHLGSVKPTDIEDPELEGEKFHQRTQHFLSFFFYWVRWERVKNERQKPQGRDTNGSLARHNHNMRTRPLRTPLEIIQTSGLPLCPRPVLTHPRPALSAMVQFIA